jgi:hypothetical protein
VRRELDIRQQFTEPIRGMGRQATEDILEVREGIDVVMFAGPFHRPDMNQQPRCALRSDDTDAFLNSARLVRYRASDASSMTMGFEAILEVRRRNPSPKPRLKPPTTEKDRTIFGHGGNET